MHPKILPQIAFSATLVSCAIAQGGPLSPLRPADSSALAIRCTVMEVFVAQGQGVNAVIFHQRDKTDGPRLGNLLKAYSSQEIDFETSDGQRHHGTVVRMKSCFGRGLLIFASGEAKLAAKDEFILTIPDAK